MAKMAKDGDKEGNNKISRVVPGRYWSFVWNNYSVEDMATLAKVFASDNIEYIFGEEVAPTTGTEHLQGFIKAKSIIRPSEKWKFPIHWEKCKGNEIQNTNYCSKKGKVHTNMRYVKDVIRDKGAFPWQQEIIDICDTEPDSRTIHWFWEKTGNVGKTELAKHLYLKYGNKMLYVNGKSADVKCAIAQCDTKPEIIIFGIPRTSQDYMSYSALEEVKDGIFFSGKYESGMVVYPIPHVFVLCNFPPEMKNLSQDRWNVKCIGDTNDDSDTDETEL